MNGTIQKNGTTLGEMLEKRRATFQAVMPRHMTVDRLIKMATTAVAKNPKLGKCTQFSLVASIVKAAELGLDVSGTLGSAYLVPFKDECTLVIGYRGLIDLARRSGQILSIEARVVWANDFFEYEYGLESKCVHRPHQGDDAGDFRCVYAVAKLKDGGTQFDVLTFGDVERVRRSSRNGESGPWKDHFSEMAKKTAVRRLVKYLPMSVEFMDAVSADESFDFEGAEEKKQGRATALAERLRLSASPVAAASEDADHPVDIAGEEESPDNIPSDSQAIENGDEAPVIYTADHCLDLAIEKKIKPKDYEGIKFRFLNPGHGNPALAESPENWRALYELGLSSW